MAPLCTSEEVNLLVYHYLKESGFHHASFSLRHESRLDDYPLSKEAIVEPGQLVRFLQKGLVYASVEAHIQDDGTEKACSSNIRLVGPPHVCDGKSRPTPPPAEPTRLSPEPDPFAAQQPRPEHKEAATQTPAAPVAKPINGVHNSKAPMPPSSLRNEVQDRSSKVASSSKKKLEDAAEGDDASSSATKPKDAKRKASTSVASDADREDKRVRRNEAADKADDASASETRREADEQSSSRKDRRNGEAQSRSASPSADKKSANDQRSKDKDSNNSKKKKGGKSAAGENGEGGKKRGDKESRGKDPKAPIPQPKGDNFVEDGQITTLSGHTGEVFISAWNPTVPNMLASGGGDATVRIWEVPDKAGELPDAPTICKHLPATQSKDISTLDWNPDGTLLASGSYDGIVRLWTPQGDLHLVMSMHQGAVISVRWNRKGNMLLTGSADGTIIVWDLNSGKPRHTFSLHSDSVLDVEWLSTADGSLKPKSTSDAPPPMPHGLSPSVADTYFATCSADNSINLCKLGEPKPVKSFKGHTDEVNAIRFDPSQTLLASVSDDTTAKIWALDIGAGGSSGIGAGTAGSAGDSLRKRASQRRGGSAHLEGMDLDEDTTQRSTEDNGSDRDREKDRATPGSVGGSTAPALASAAKERSSPAPGSNGLPSSASNNLLSTTGKGPNKGLRLTLSGHTKELYAVAWCPTGPGSANPDQPRMLATSSFDWTARLWNADNGDCLRVIDAHEDNVYTLRFSPCARYLATGGIDKKVVISRVDNGALVQQYLGGGAIFDIAWKDMHDTVETKQEEGESGDKPRPLAKRHQLAISQADRKLTVLNLADLDAVESTATFKAPPPVEAKTETSAGSDKPPKKQARGGV
ncbi:related to Nuclear receptor co-repressor/HDAC3 complex subunit TBLR1 [Ustilago trichophora]|uniref:Related to Nuclear receptor co-repressor/HDAC3 complex subunit TBLR1 n=1 Tax=Ustilago trichophora TaxID=86804 RepID=A0A5C3DPQ0_9BASI|nr:related to Nuclear receptor co-repressor/HDAC3 complex subunit TBLR1 [Ustilago trichophora]